MLPMYGVPKPFSVTCHGPGNIALTVEDEQIGDLPIVSADMHAD